jgi:outer membrane lipoprotein-sorting protein
VSFRPAILALAITLCSLTPLARAAEPAGPGDAPAGVDKDFWKQLVEIDARGGVVKDLSANFTQQKYTPLMKKPLVSTGTIKIKGGTALWNTTQPAPTVMRIDERDLHLFYPDQKVVEVYAVDQKMGPLAASPFPRLALIKPHFSFERGAAKGLLPAGADASKYVAVRMRPIDAEMRKHIDEVTVLLEIATGLVLRAQTVDPDGDRIVLTFSDMKVNAGLTDKDVQMTLPAGVKVTRPLEGGRATSSGEAEQGRNR